MSDLAHHLGREIRKLRVERGYTQEELSDRAAIHYTFLGHIERGNKLPSLLTLAKIAVALSVSLSSLFKGAGR